MENILFVVIGLILGCVIAYLYAKSALGSEHARSLEQVRQSAQDQLTERVEERLEVLREDAIEKTRRRVSKELEEDLREEVRAHLSASMREGIEREIREHAEARAERIGEQAEATKRATIARAEAEAKRIEAEATKQAEAQMRERRAEIERVEERLDKRESNLDGRAEKLDDKERQVEEREERARQLDTGIDRREREIAQRAERAEAEIERVSSLTRDQARQEIIDRVIGQAKIDAAKQVRQLEEQAMEEADKRAKKVISIAIQRYAGEYAAERCVSVVPLPSDDLKGRIIGREGRNIRALEAATGIDVIIDDTPEAVIVSGFDPVRREIARLSLEKLVSDGRIHPSRIEEVVSKTEQEVALQIKEAGEQAAFELGIHGLHGELIKLLGRLRYRTSYGQNMWSHSIEVGFLCGLMASELGINVKLARRAGLLHDIGKALTHEQEGSHALIGAELAAKYGEVEIVRNAIAAHHNEEPQNSVIAHLVIAADALSGARPGARREILETYIQRLEDLERISLGFEGVEKSFAIQAGREIRVLVQNSQVNDDQAFVLSKEIARKIEDELTYPGQIKVTVIRETRAVEFAR